MMDDWHLLQQYTRRQSEAAFRMLVERYVNLVHSCALRQVHDAPLAEEVSQAVFLLLARKAGGFRRGVVLPGWLVCTTRFVAARAIRAQQRRQRREQEAVRMQQLSTPDQVWARLAPVLDEGLARLGSKERDAIVLRYLQDKNLREIGAALGITEEAAKKRVCRAVEKLRAFFGRRGFSVPALILTGVLAQHGVEAAPAGLGATIASRVLAQGAAAAPALPELVRETIEAWRWAKAKAAVSLGVTPVLLAILVGLALPKEPPAASGRTGAADTALASAASQAARNTSGSPESGPPASADTLRLAFRAIDAVTGAGVGGVSLHARFWHGAQVDRRDDLRTDAEGNCAVRLPDLDLGRMDVGALMDGYVQKCVTWMPVDGDPIPSEYVMTLERGVGIGGRVLDELGNPVPQAEICVQFAEAGVVNPREPPREQLGFVDDLVVTKTDEMGRWLCTVLPPDYTRFWLQVKHPSFTAVRCTTDQDDRDYAGSVERLRMSELRAGNALVVLRRGFQLSGAVVDDNQQPVAGATIEIGQMSGAPVPTARTRADGSFIISNVPPGEVEITATAEGLAPAHLAIGFGADTAPLRIQLNRGLPLRLRVVDENGAGLAGALVADETAESGNAPTGGWKASTDNDGRVRWDAAPRRPLRIYAGKTGYFNSRRNTVTPDGEEHTLTLRKAFAVSGWVTDAETRLTIPSFKAIPGFGISKWSRQRTAPGTNGEYHLTFDELSPNFLVRIEAEGYETAVSKPLVPNGDGVVCNFELARADERLAVSGVVRLPDGAPAVGAEVALCTLENSIVLGDGRFLNRDQDIVTDTDAGGRFRFPLVHAAHTVVAVHAVGFGRTRLQERGQEVQLALQPWGRIEGVVRTRDGHWAGREVQMWDYSMNQYAGAVIPDSTSAFSVRTDDQGRFGFGRVPPGDFDLYLWPASGGIGTYKTPVRIAPGETARVQIGGQQRTLTGRLALPRSDGSIGQTRPALAVSLRTRLPPFVEPKALDGAALELWKVDFWQSERGVGRMRADRYYQAAVAADGSFRLPDVMPGVYELGAHTADRSFRREVVVPDSAEGESGGLLDLGSVEVWPITPPAAE